MVYTSYDIMTALSNAFERQTGIVLYNNHGKDGSIVYYKDYDGVDRFVFDNNKSTLTLNLDLKHPITFGYKDFDISDVTNIIKSSSINVVNKLNRHDYIYNTIKHAFDNLNPIEGDYAKFNFKGDNELHYGYYTYDHSNTNNQKQGVHEYIIKKVGDDYVYNDLDFVTGETLNLKANNFDSDYEFCKNVIFIITSNYIYDKGFELIPARINFMNYKYQTFTRLIEGTKSRVKSIARDGQANVELEFEFGGSFGNSDHYDLCYVYINSILTYVWNRHLPLEYCKSSSSYLFYSGKYKDKYSNKKDTPEYKNMFALNVTEDMPLVNIVEKKDNDEGKVSDMMEQKYNTIDDNDDEYDIGETRGNKSLLQDGITKARVVGLTLDNLVIAYRIKTDRGSYDVTVDKAEQFGLSGYKVEKAIPLLRHNGVLVTKSELSNKRLIPNISHSPEDIRKLVDIIFS